jgi:hypothetical protein
MELHLLRWNPVILVGLVLLVFCHSADATSVSRADQYTIHEAESRASQAHLLCVFESLDKTNEVDRLLNKGLKQFSAAGINIPQTSTTLFSEVSFLLVANRAHCVADKHILFRVFRI